MPTRVCIPDRIIIDIGIPIQSLHPGRDNRVRVDVPQGGFAQTSQGGVVESCVIEHQAEIRGVAVLSRVGVVCLLCSRLIPLPSRSTLWAGFVHGLAEHKSAGAGDKGGAPQVVAEDEVQRVVLAHDSCVGIFSALKFCDILG